MLSFTVALLGSALCVSALPSAAVSKRDMAAAMQAMAEDPYVPYFPGFACAQHQDLFTDNLLTDSNTWPAGALEGDSPFIISGPDDPITYQGFSYLDSTTPNSVLPLTPNHAIATSFKGAAPPIITGVLDTTWFGLESLYYTCVSNDIPDFLTPVAECTVRFTAVRMDGSVVSQDSSVTPANRDADTFGPYEKIVFDDDFYALKTVTIELISSSSENVLLALTDVVLGACAAVPDAKFAASVA